MSNGEQKNIKVAVRVRPYNRRELETNQRTIIKVMDKTTLLFDPDEEDDEFFFQGVKQHYRDMTKRVNKKLSMDFDRVFDTESSNEDLFEECTMPLVESVMNGYNCSVFVYGATGAGKTFTMLGSEDCRGLTYLTMQELFNKIGDLSETRKFDIGVSYLEVYNEQVMNLLTKSGPLKLREDSNGVVVSGLVLKPIFSADELLELLAQGNNNRTQHPTDANAESSRSHAVFQVHIRMTDKKSGQKRTVKLSMIDLAGSERAASTRGIGVRFKEGASINKSLLALGNCINKLADGMKHIPYRDSNLTRILKDSLGGNCQTLMIANVSMSSLTYEDTYNTLKYASRAKKIRTTLRKNVMKSNMPKEFYVKKNMELQDENDRLQEIIKNLENKLATATKSATTSKSYDESELQCWYRKIDAVYSSVIKAQEYYYGMQSKEKILKFRCRLKEKREKFKKILTLDTMPTQNDTSRFEASIDRFGKQIFKQKEDLVRWRKKLQESLKDIKKLNKEVNEAKCSNILQIYLTRKGMEVQTSKQNIKTNHIAKLNSLYHADYEHLVEMFSLGCEIVQKDYVILKFDVGIASEHSEKLEKLRKLMNGNGIKFKDDENKESEDEFQLSFDENPSDNENGIEIQVNGKRKNNSSDEEDGVSMYKRNKRLFDDIVDLGDGTMQNELDIFKRPVDGNPDETQVLSSTVDITDYNSTFEVSSLGSNKKTDLITGILCEDNSSAANRLQIKKALLKSNITRDTVLKTVKLGIQKENQKFSPSRVRKSPRTTTITSRALASTANFLKRQKAKATGSSSTAEPAVRINRTASLRIKKT
ncbi:kinesin-like protein KIF18A [Episyrphus balteatus]|uniref:kinesin-like protein KIF18A n=1 Tax=Episyrphus balteatus TaxID=286459 RepID=UPI002485B6D6|nr:kinesin-like protein KIF18A [Episyrphus balteatus]